jgi:protease-4
MNFFRILFLPITAPIRFIQRNFKTVLFLSFLVYLAVNSDPKAMQKPNLQIIELSGVIMNADDVLAKITKAKNDKTIKGVLFKVNSPGGAVAPSVELSYAIKELSNIKPVIAYASGTMASGSYYSSIWANKIIANPGSIVGSIGVIMQSFDASELMKKVGVKTQIAKIGTYKEAGTPTRKWTKQEKAELDKVIKSTYDTFVTDVANARKLKKQDHKVFADAHIFTSSQAKEVGLIDQVGTINIAKKELIKLAKVKKPIWSKVDPMEKFMQKIIQGTVSNISSNLNGLMAY